MRGLVLVGGLCLAMQVSAMESLVEVLPEVRERTRGEVPLSEPVAPVPVRSSWDFALTGAVGLADAFHSKVALTLDARRSFGRWSAGGFAGRAFSWADGAFALCSSAGTCTLAPASRLSETPGDLGWMGGAGVSLRAAEGKLSFGGLELPGFRVDASADAAVVGYEARGTHWAPGLRVGVGASGSVSRLWSVGLSLSSLLYWPSIRGERAVERQLLLGVGVALRPGASP